MEKKQILGMIGFAAIMVSIGVVASRFYINGDYHSAIVGDTITLKTSYLFPQPQALKSFELIDQQGQPFTNKQLKGQWSLIFMGFTSCPDICPTTMNKLARVYKQLLAITPLQVIFLSVDPKRDTPQQLKNYMNFFNPEFVAITGEHSQLYPLSRDLGMVYAMVENGDSYTVDHSASMALISPGGQKVAIIKPKSKNNQIPQIDDFDLITDLVAIIQHQ